LEQEIARQVHALYGITKEAIAIVEGSTGNRKAAAQDTAYAVSH